MNRRKADPGLTKRGKRHPLLYQERLSEQLFWPCIGILAASIAILVWNPDSLAPRRSSLMAIVVSVGLVLVLTQLSRLMAYAQCQVQGLSVRLPFYRLRIPYRRIRTIRPAELFRLYPPAGQRWTQRRFLRPLFGRTVLVVELDQLPRSHRWMRLRMGKYMLCPDAVGLILPVRDWMSFRAELDEFRSRFRDVE